MSSDIVLTAALRSNLLSLQSTQRLIDTTQLRLATGLKVNSALDNPQNFFAAQSLNNRANDLSRLLDGIGQSIRTIEEADKGVKALSKLIEQAESVAQEAQSEIRAAEGFARIRGNVDLRNLNLTTDLGGSIVNAASDQFNISITRDVAGVSTTTALAADINISATDTVDNIVAAINADANIGANATTQLVRASVTSGGQLQIESLVEGGLLRINQGAANTVTAAGFAALGLDTVVGNEAVNAVVTGRSGGTAVAGRILTSDAIPAASANASGKFEASTLLTNAAGGAGFITANEDAELTITIDGQSSLTGTFDANTQTVQDVIDFINNDATINGSVTATFNTDSGRIELEFADSVGQAEITLGAVNAGDTPLFGFGTGAADAANFTAGTDSQSELFTFVGTSADLDQFEDDFNTVLAQIDDIVEDAQFRGVNLLNGDNLTTFFNEDRDNSLTTEGVDFSALGLGIAEGDFTNAANVQL